MEKQKIMITEFHTGINYVENLFSAEELEVLYNCINKPEAVEEDPDLGRSKIHLSTTPEYLNIIKRLEDIASFLLKKDMMHSHTGCVEYSNKSGQPNLPPHFDGDRNNLVFDYQLESNTTWDLGLGTKLYPLKDNSAIIFNANEYVHWRPHKNFKDGEYIKMLFFRFYNKHNTPDYTHLAYKQDHPIFKDARELRESLNK